MDLFIIRHAWAAERDDAAYPDDSLRPLTDEGRNRFARMVEALVPRGLTPQLIVTSPMLRCLQTAEILATGPRREDQGCPTERIAPRRRSEASAGLDGRTRLRPGPGRLGRPCPGRRLPGRRADRSGQRLARFEERGDRRHRVSRIARIGPRGTPVAGDGEDSRRVAAWKAILASRDCTISQQSSCPAAPPYLH